MGTAWVQALTDATSGHDCFIAQITGAEMVAAVTRRLRRGQLMPADAALAEMQAEFMGDFFQLEVSLPRVQAARALAERHGLCGYDAVQLATALFLRLQCRTSGLLDPLVISSDVELNMAALAEGLAVDNPNNHGPVAFLQRTPQSAILWVRMRLKKLQLQKNQGGNPSFVCRSTPYLACSPSSQRHSRRRQ